MRRIITILGLFIVVAMNTYGSTYWVSNSGSDSADGSQGTPWRTPGYASKQMVGGDTLILMPGDYYMAVYYDDMITPPSGSPQKWTAIIGQSSGKPRIFGSNSLLAAIEMAEKDYIYISNLEITSLIDSPYTGGFRGGVYALTGADDQGSSYLTVENLYIHHIEETPLNLAGNCDHVTVRKCDFRYSAGTLIASEHFEQGSGLQYVLVDSCYLGYGGHFSNGKEQKSDYDRPDGFGIEKSEGPIEIKNTISEHNWGDGLDSKSKRTYVHNCIVQNNFADGVKLWGDSSRLENTLIYGIGDNDPQGTPWVLLILESDLPNSYFEVTNVTMHDGSARGHYAGTFQYQLTNPSTILMRNCLIQSNGSRLYCESTINLIAKNNLFYITGEETQIQANGNEYDLNNIGDLGTGNIYGDPKLVNPVWGGQKGDYHLSQESPAVNAGINESGVPSYDLEYLPRPAYGKVDIGCYEFQTGTGIEEVNTDPNDRIVDLIYPNPADKFVIIKMNNKLNKIAGKIVLTIYNYLNEEVTRFEKVNDTEYWKIDISQYPAGYYSLVLSSPYSREVEKLIIK